MVSSKPSWTARGPQIHRGSDGSKTSSWLRLGVGGLVSTHRNELKVLPKQIPLQDRLDVRCVKFPFWFVR